MAYVCMNDKLACFVWTKFKHMIIAFLSFTWVRNEIHMSLKRTAVDEHKMTWRS